MVGKDPNTNNSPNHGKDTNPVSEHLRLAAKARTDGHLPLSIHLYLAAFEIAKQSSAAPSMDVIQGLRQAWEIACESKERSLAEYIFEKLEPYLSSEEIPRFANTLQGLALDKLEEFGLSRGDIEEMSDSVSRAFFGADSSPLVTRFEEGVPPSDMFGVLQRGLVKAHRQEQVESGSEAAEVSSASDSVSDPDLGGGDSQEQQSPVSTHDKTGQLEPAADRSGGILAPNPPIFPESIASLFNMPIEKPHGSASEEHASERMRFSDLVGYRDAIESMRIFGIGVDDDEEYKELLVSLGEKHGLESGPMAATYLFRAPVREDANQFMFAAMGELQLPVIRMRMEEGFQGMPVLAVMASADNQPRFNQMKNTIEGRSILVLEDIDLWSAPFSGSMDEEGSGLMHVQLSRGAREALNLIQSAIENPDVFILLSAAGDGEMDPFFLDLFGNITLIEIDYPTISERAELWDNIVNEHPSLGNIKRELLVRLSAHLSRYDIYMAAREAVEEAYRESLKLKKYIPVSESSIFEKMAAYQPLESEEYKKLEDLVAENFRNSLENDDDFLSSMGD